MNLLGFKITCSTSVALAYLNTVMINFKIIGIPYALDYTPYVQ